MKLSRTAWLILGIGVFAIAFVSLYVVYLQQGREQQRLDDSLSLAQATLPTVVLERDDLKNALAQATSLLNAARSGFPDSVDSIRVDEKLFEIAKICDLKITSLTTSEPSDEEVETVTYSVAPFVVDVKGEVADILDFINTIATDEYFTNTTVELVDIVVPEPLTEKEKRGLTEAAIAGRETPSATIDLIIYGYQGE